MVFFCILDCPGDRGPGCIVKRGVAGWRRSEALDRTAGSRDSRSAVDELGAAPGGFGSCRLRWLATSLAAGSAWEIQVTARSRESIASDLWRPDAREVEEGPAWFLIARSGRFSRKRSGNFGIRAKSRQRMRPRLGSRDISAVCRSVFRPGPLRSATSQPLPSSPSRAEGSLFEAAEWSLFVRYRQLLAELGAEDDAGYAVWASQRLAGSPRFWAKGRDTGPIILLDLEQPAPAHGALSNDR